MIGDRPGTPGGFKTDDGYKHIRCIITRYNNKKLRFCRDMQKRSFYSVIFERGIHRWL